LRKLLFQSLDKPHRLTGEAILRHDMLDMVKKRCIAVGLSEEFCNHTFRGTGMTVFLSNGGSLEAVQGNGEPSRPTHDQGIRQAEGPGVAKRDFRKP
jgi:hypothetical protein